MSSKELTPLVSVVVPIYNVEKYLPTCLDSILAQTLSQIEIIGVDDGSTDGSGQILEEYARKESRIRAIHQANAGLGPARNVGIDIARGQYIGFVDSDDWVHPDMYEKLYEIAKRTDADVVTCGHEIWTDGALAQTLSHPLAGCMLDSARAVDKQRKEMYGRGPGDMIGDPFPVSVCMGIMKRVVFDSARFENILSEDAIFDVQAFKAVSKWAISNDCEYCYRKDCQESITRSFSDNKLDAYLTFFKRLMDLASAEADDKNCILRAQRKITDYARSYVVMVEKSELTHAQKRKEVEKLFTALDGSGLLVGFSAGSLPAWQRVTYEAMRGGHTSFALLLACFRRIITGER